MRNDQTDPAKDADQRLADIDYGLPRDHPVAPSRVEDIPRYPLVGDHQPAVEQQAKQQAETNGRRPEPEVA